MQPLIEEQKRTFVRDGFPHAPELVPRRLLAALRPLDVPRYDFATAPCEEHTGDH